MGSSILINDAPPSTSNPLVTDASFLTSGANGATNFRLISAATTNATVVKASPGAIGGGTAFNTSAATKFLKLYNKASAPTVGTDVPIMTIPIAPSASFNISDAFDIYGIFFSLGIAFAITGASPDADTTALALGDVIVNLTYA